MRQDGTGERIPQDRTVSAEQAASDLTMFRDGISDNIEAAETQQIRDDTDAPRAGDQQQHPVQNQAEPQRQQADQPQQQQATGDDEVARALQNPKVLAAIQYSLGQATQQYTAAADQFVNGLAQNAATAV